MPDFDFGVHITTDNPVFDISKDTYTATMKFAVQMREQVDDVIIAEIQKAAISEGITDMYVLDKKNIVSAMQKQIPKKPTEKDIGFGDKALSCPTCGEPVTNYWKPTTRPAHCQFCGQAIDWGV